MAVVVDLPHVGGGAGLPTADCGLTHLFERVDTHSLAIVQPRVPNLEYSVRADLRVPVGPVLAARGLHQLLVGQRAGTRRRVLGEDFHVLVQGSHADRNYLIQCCSHFTLLDHPLGFLLTGKANS